MVFDKNYYQGNPNRTDSNNDGIFDTPFELNDYVKAWSGVLVVDNHPLANPHGILNFTFPDIDAILTGIVRLNWTAYDLREINNITYSLFRLNGAEWNHINDVYQVQQMDFNTTMLADGVYTFKLTVISYSARANRTQTIEIQFSLSIYNEGDPPVTTTIPVETTSTSLDNTVTTTVTETTTEVSIETTTRTESEVNAPFMIFIALLLPLAAKFTIHYKK